MKSYLFATVKIVGASPLPKIAASALLLLPLITPAVQADEKALKPPVVEDWSDVSRITKDNDWSGVPGFMGYRGDKLAGKPGMNPQTIVADGLSTPVDVIANQKNPTSLRTGGVAEFDGIPNPTIAIKGSGTASAPFLLLNLDTRGKHNITIGYKLRDLDASANNAVQAVALQYRTQADVPFTDIPAAFAPDASTGPNQATLVTPIVVILPANADDQALVQVRWITANADGNDEWIGIDDIAIIGDDLGTTAGTSGEKTRGAKPARPQDVTN
ncbi:MAG: hypothetical protein U1F83_10870 [Verrucomicrobiota bacterium]